MKFNDLSEEERYVIEKKEQNILLQVFIMIFMKRSFTCKRCNAPLL